MLALAVALMFIALVYRLAAIQVRDHEQYTAEAAVTHRGAVSVPAPRGAILDAGGYPLAVSVDAWDVYLDSYLWRDGDRASRAAIELADALGGDADVIMALGTSRTAGDVLLRRRLPYEQGVALRAQELWGVRTLPSSTRVYPEGDLAGPIVGFIGLDGSGLWGVEADFEGVLGGRPGLVSSERDALDRPIAFGTRTELPPVAGGEVQLTIDRFIQAIAERELAVAVEQYEAAGGAVLVMNPHSGEVLAMASHPAVGPASADLDDPALASLVRNRAVTDVYEPGSVLKTLTTAAAIDLGRVTPDSTYRDTGRAEVGGYVIRNWDFHAYGEVTVTEYLQRSLNTGAVWLAGEIGADDFYRYLRAFGLGEPTHIGLSGEAEGLMRSPDQDGWYPVDLATNAYGQGLAATPIQVLTAVNVFANGGRLMRPYVVSRQITRDEVRTYDPVEVRRVVSETTARTMSRLMLDVVEGVPWHGARVDGYRVAGKTGTTLVSIPTGYDLDSTIASFAGFLPYEAPRVSVLVKIDQPAGDLNLGGQVAAPVFARIASQVMEYLRVPQTDALAAQRAGQP